MRLFSDSIGRKSVMAVTGTLMLVFVTVHLLGNMTIFAGPSGINAYAAGLAKLPPLVWGNRLVMGTALVLHVIYAITLTLENWRASPVRYAIRRSLQLTLAGKWMIWTGLIMAAFVTYHVLHFTVHAMPGVVVLNDSLNRIDVFNMVYVAFQNWPIAILYVVGMVALFLHLSHGVQSLFQTFGLNNAFFMPRLEKGGMALSLVYMVAFAAIPLTILIGILTK